MKALSMVSLLEDKNSKIDLEADAVGTLRILVDGTHKRHNGLDLAASLNRQDYRLLARFEVTAIERFRLNRLQEFQFAVFAMPRRTQLLWAIERYCVG
jgi:hypothetical protein